MKKYILGFLCAVLSFSVRAEDVETVYRTLTLGVSHIAASTTNTTGGEIMPLPSSPTPMRIWLKGNGVAATTNGVSGVSNLVVRIVTASGNLGTTNEFDTGNISPIKLTLAPLGTSTNVVSDYFELRGARYMKIGAVQNNYLGPVSNLTVYVGYPK